MFQNESIFDYRSPFSYSSTGKFGETLDEEKYGRYQSLKDGEFRESLLSRIIRSIIIVICFTLITFTFPISCFFCIKKVPSLERIVVFRLGKMLKVKGPGLVFTFPCIDHWLSVDLRPQIYHIPKQQLLTSDGAIVELGSCLHYQVIDVVKSVLQVDKLNEIAKQLADQCLTNATVSRVQEDMERNIYKLEVDIQNMLNRTTISWGLEVTQVDIGPVTIIKPAEPQNVAETMMTVLKATFQPSGESVPSMPQISRPPVGENDKLRSVVKTISEMLLSKSNESALEDCPGVVKFIVEDVGEDVYVCIRDGRGKAFITTSSNAGEPDVVVRLTLNALEQLVNRELSPLQAYADGLVKANGNLMLLKAVGDVFAESFLKLKN